MSKRFNNKKLIYLLAGLIVILLLTIIVKIPKENATIKSRLFDLDTLQVSKIILYPKINNGIPVEFNKNNMKWSVQQGDIISATRNGAVQNMFTEALNIKPQRLVTRDKSKWKEFELTDSLGTRIKFLNNKGKVMTDLMIGKFTYKQVANPYGGDGGNNIRGTSFVRLFNEKEVYAVDGFLSFYFNLKFEDWRDNSFIKADKNDITNVRFIYPADSSFNISKEGAIWRVESQETDSVNVENYLNTLVLLNGQYIKNNYKPVLSPISQIMVEGNNLLNITIKCFKVEGVDEYILNSSLNPEIYFTTGTDGIYKKLFKSREYFVKK